jgi:hypothetical protein
MNREHYMISVDLVRAGRVTTATVHKDGIVGTGGAIRVESDSPSEYVSEYLAVGRALTDLGDQMRKKGHKMSNVRSKS